ncbi:MAG: pyridoxamine 5'-phosphate oxidase family protein [Candidatus Acidiferrum sp.]
MHRELCGRRNVDAKGTAMNVDEVYQFMKSEQLAVLATVGEDQRPEAALMGFAVTEELEIVFDTVKSSRKYPNLKKNPRVAWVIGCTTEITVQFEGVAEELEGEELAKYKKTYFAAFPDGPARESWPGITYFVVRPKWVRYCDYDPARRRIEEQEFV